VTKLVAITRPSLYELLPSTIPHWECVAADGSRTRVSAQDVLSVGSWEPYWPSPELERRVFLNDWLKKGRRRAASKSTRPTGNFARTPISGRCSASSRRFGTGGCGWGASAYTNTLLTLRANRRD
jgi:hypothetical protein